MKKRGFDPLTPPPWEQLHSWVALVEVGSVSGAARRLGVSQAGVSQHVRQLEEGFGSALLDRSTRPARPTAAGHRLYEHARELLVQAHQMGETVRTLGRSRRTLLRVGCVDSFAAAIGPDLVRGLSGRVQRLRLVSGINPGLAEQFDNHQLDVLVTTDPPVKESGRQSAALFSEHFVLALPADLKVPPMASMQQLAQLRPFMHYSVRSRMGMLVDAYLRQHDPDIEKVFEFDATDPLLSLVCADLGFALTTPLCLWQSRFHAQRLQICTLESLRTGGQPYPALQRTFHLVFRPDELGALAQDIITLVRVAAQDLQRQMVAALGLPAHRLLAEADSAYD
ncbi:MAG: LysR family transcriptional regulator [Limnohabitans sp.]